MTIAGGYQRHPQRHQMDRHRRLGVGGPRRLRRLQSGLEALQEAARALRKVKLYKSNNHQRNFLDCVKSRQPTITPVETAHHSAIPGHLGLISMLTGRKIRWNVEQEVIIDDPEASKLMTREYRPPWTLS